MQLGHDIVSNMMSSAISTKIAGPCSDSEDSGGGGGGGRRLRTIDRRLMWKCRAIDQYISFGSS